MAEGDSNKSSVKEMAGVASIALLPCGSIYEESSSKSSVKEMVGVASIALLPCGSISGHFIHLPHSTCYGLHGTELECERECSRGEDYRLIKLNIIDFNTKREEAVVVECKGHDAARFHNIDHAHGWENDIVKEVEKKQTKNKISVSFECEALKADKAAEDHIQQFMPKLAGMDAVINIGKMTIMGLDFEDEVVREEDWKEEKEEEAKRRQDDEGQQSESTTTSEF